MFWILLLLSFCNITASRDENHRYIDLLPEKEKSEFLERIARRILEETKIKNVPQDSHADISDEQLDAQAAYVQGVMKDEEESFKKENRSNNRKSNDISHDTQNTQSDKVINENIEIESKREKRKDIDVVPLDTIQLLNETTIIPVKAVYDHDFEYGNVEESTKNETFITTIKPEIKDVTTEYILKTSSLTPHATPVSQSINNTNNLKKSKLNHTELHNETIVTSITISKMPINNLEITRTIKNNTNVEPKSSQVLYVDTSYSGPNRRFVEQYNNSSDNVLKTTQKVDGMKNISISTVSSSTVVVTYLNTSQANDTYFNQDESIEINSTHLTKEYSNAVNLDVNINKSRDVIFEKELNDTNLQVNNSNDNTNFGYSELATKEQSHLNKLEVMNKTAVNNELGVENRQGDKLPFETNEDSNIGITNIDNTTTHVNNSQKYIRVAQDQRKNLSKAYDVYEIAANSEPFVRKDKLEYVSVQEQPYYVPVYNYDPENAYFDPSNRYGPNTKSDDDEIKVLRSRLESQKHNGAIYKSSISDPLKYLHNIIRPPTKEKQFHGIQFNPNDYFDIDYYSGRGDSSRKRSPDSIERDQLHNSIDKSFKDRLWAIRNLTNILKIIDSFYSNKKGVADVFVDDGKTAEKSNPPKGNVKRYQSKKIPISMDYYFARNLDTPPDRVADPIMPLTENPKATNIFKDNMKRGHNITTSNVLNINKKVNFNYNALLRVFKDMIQMDNQALVEYDWLESTVDIRAGVKKVIDLIQNFNYNKRIHPKDLELLKYVFYLYKASIIKIDKENNSFYKGRLYLDHPKPKRPLNNAKREFTGKKRLKENSQEDEEYDQQVSVLFELEDFLQEVLFQLNDLHRKIKRIAASRTYSTQDWYNDVRRVYFNRATDHQLGTVLLHLSLARVFRLIDDSAGRARNGFRQYVKEHPREVKRNKKEFIFLLKVLEELRWK